MSKMKFVGSCAISALLGVTGCWTVQQDPDLVFHCTFDDDAAILSPKVGPGGAVKGATYRDGKIGKALYVPAKSSVATFPFPEGLPAEQGTIEFWGKIENDKASYGDGCDPYLFIVTKDGATGWPVVFELNFNANNGCGASGLFCGMSYGRAVNVQGRGNSYASILGEENPKGWHQYRVVWKTSGVDSNGNIMQIWIDGKLAGSGMRGEKIAEDFRKGISGPVHLVFSNPQSGHGASPVCVDDFKMWSVAKEN